MRPHHIGRIHHRNAGGGNNTNGGGEIANLAALAEQLRAAFDEHAESIDEALETRDARITGLAATLNDLEQKFHKRGQAPGGGDTIETLGQRFTRAPAFADWVKAGIRQGMVFSASLETRAVTSAALGGRDRIAEIGTLPKRRPRIRDLLRVVPTSQSSIEFVRQTSRVSNAAPVTEGSEKPQSSVDFELVNEPCRTLAHWVPASRQVLDDVADLAATIDADLINGLELLEEDQVLNGDGTGQSLYGIIPQATPFSPIALAAPANAMDVIAVALAQLVNSGVEPDGICLNTSDWLLMVTAKDSIGQYFGTGGPFSAGPSTLWGRPVVATPAIDSGSFLVGGFFIGASLHDRMVANVLISTEDRDNFIKNMVTLLGEERVALAVRRPGNFVFGSLSSTSSGA